MPNLDAEMQRVMEGVARGTPLLLHACCAPCSTIALERLCGTFAVTLFYDNPNIMPREEYEKRFWALRSLAAQMETPFPLLMADGPYEPDVFLEAARGLEAVPEGGARCAACIGLRMERAAAFAAAHGFKWVCSTLSTGPRKDAAQVYEAGSRAAAVRGMRFLPADFKKREGYKRSVALCKEYGLYRQHYCGCAFSLPKEGMQPG